MPPYQTPADVQSGYSRLGLQVNQAFKNLGMTYAQYQAFLKDENGVKKIKDELKKAYHGKEYALTDEQLSILDDMTPKEALDVAKGYATTVQKAETYYKNVAEAEKAGYPVKLGNQVLSNMFGLDSKTALVNPAFDKLEEGVKKGLETRGGEAVQGIARGLEGGAQPDQAMMEAASAESVRPSDAEIRAVADKTPEGQKFKVGDFVYTRLASPPTEGGMAFPGTAGDKRTDIYPAGGTAPMKANWREEGIERVPQAALATGGRQEVSQQNWEGAEVGKRLATEQAKTMQPIMAETASKGIALTPGASFASKEAKADLTNAYPSYAERSQAQYRATVPGSKIDPISKRTKAYLSTLSDDATVARAKGNIDKALQIENEIEAIKRALKKTIDRHGDYDTPEISTFLEQQASIENKAVDEESWKKQRAQAALGIVDKIREALPYSEGSRKESEAQLKNLQETYSYYFTDVEDMLKVAGQTMPEQERNIFLKGWDWMMNKSRSLKKEGSTTSGAAPTEQPKKTGNRDPLGLGIN